MNSIKIFFLIGICLTVSHAQVTETVTTSSMSTTMSPFSPTTSAPFENMTMITTTTTTMITGNATRSTTISPEFCRFLLEFGFPPIICQMKK